MSRRSNPDRGLCPVCRRPAVTTYLPFCGQGCRDRDLLAWLGDGYRIPGPPADPHEIGGDGLDSAADRRL